MSAAPERDDDTAARIVMPWPSATGAGRGVKPGCQHGRRRRGARTLRTQNSLPYKPAAKRRWGYYALPILYRDRLVGKLDAAADRKAGVLRVDAIHEDVTFDKTMTAAVDREIKDLARWFDLGLPG